MSCPRMDGVGGRTGSPGSGLLRGWELRVGGGAVGAGPCPARGRAFLTEDQGPDFQRWVVEGEEQGAEHWRVSAGRCRMSQLELGRMSVGPRRQYTRRFCSPSSLHVLAEHCAQQRATRSSLSAGAGQARRQCHKHADR